MALLNVNKMDIITRKVFSYCEDIPEQLQEKFEEYTCDVYVEKEAIARETQLKPDYKYSYDELAALLVELGAEDGETVLIHIDY